MFNDLRKIIEEISSPSYVITKPKSEDGIDGRIVAYVDKTSQIAEQYRILRTNLYSISTEKPVKTIVITSSQSGEGKTTTSCNLAMTLSWDTKKKILLLDGDLRKPEVHALFNLPRKPGLSDLILEKCETADLTAKPSIGNLYVIPSGSTITNPAEVLSYPRFKALIAEFKARFDYVIFDTPPTLTVADSTIIGSLCDGVIFVVKSEVTSKDIVTETFHLLKNAQAKPIACVLTNFHAPFHYYFKYKSYYNYLYKPKR